MLLAQVHCSVCHAKHPRSRRPAHLQPSPPKHILNCLSCFWWGGWYFSDRPTPWDRWPSRVLGKSLQWTCAQNPQKLNYGHACIERKALYIQLHVPMNEQKNQLCMYFMCAWGLLQKPTPLDLNACTLSEGIQHYDVYNIRSEILNFCWK